jgi:prephenate dehydratase
MSTPTAPDRPLVLAALGGPHTFGGQAAAIMLSRYPEFSEITYVGSADEVLPPDGTSWHADAGCVPEQTSKTGFHVATQRTLAANAGKMFVLAEVSHAYHCGLYVKPGTGTGAIRRVIGHTGSLNQSRDWLAAHLPQAAIEVVHTHSVGAATTVAEGDGTLAAVCTPEIAIRLGLHLVAADIDGGSTGHYWALSPYRRFAASPTRVVVAGRTTGDGALSDTLCELRSAGFLVRTIWTEKSGGQMFAQQVVATLAGGGRLADVEAAVSEGSGDLWLTGAFVSREQGEGATE